MSHCLNYIDRNIHSITLRLKQNKVILANFSYLSILQGFNLLSPLITYPYLLKTIGIEQYGIVIFAQTIMTYVSIVINFGFNINGVHQVSSNRENPILLSEIVSSIYINKLILWVFCFLFYILIVFTVPFFEKYKILYLFSFFITINDLLFPVWYFQGIEKMKYITYINVLVRLLFIFLIFLVIKNEEDYLYIPLINGLGALLGGIIALYIILKKEKIKFIYAGHSKILSYLKDSFPIFLSGLSTQLYININKLIVGASLGMSDVTIYDLGEKITSLMKIPIYMISQAVFPKISREKNISFLNKIMFVLSALVCIEYIILLLICKWIIIFFVGYYLAEAVSIISILGISSILLVLTSFMGGCRLIPFGLKTEYMKIMLANCGFYIILICILYSLDSLNIYTISFATIAVEIFCLGLLWIVCRKFKILHSKVENDV